MGRVLIQLASLVLLTLPAEIEVQSLALHRKQLAREIEPASHPKDFQFIGKMECKTRVSRVVTSAILVSNRQTVLTVAHFNFDPRTDQAIPTDQCRFQLLNPEKSEYFESTISVLSSGGDHTLNSLIISTDWAIIRLASEAPSFTRPIASKMDFLGDATLRVRLVDYSGSRTEPKQHNLQTNCLAKPIAHRFMLLAHRCESSKGSSGGALVATFNGKPTLVAMHSGRTSDSGIAIRIGGHLSRMIDEFAERSPSS